LEDPIAILMYGCIARFRGAAVAYQLGLCKHEQANRLQGRLDLARKAGVANDDDVRKAREAWEQADHTWKRYLEEHPDSPAISSAIRRRGETLLALGNRDAAAKLWQGTEGVPTDQRKLALLWLLKQPK
jgi:hypothetical protein